MAPCQSGNLNKMTSAGCKTSIDTVTNAMGVSCTEVMFDQVVNLNHGCHGGLGNHGATMPSRPGGRLAVLKARLGELRGIT